MDTDKIKIIIMNLEMLLRELKDELRVNLKNVEQNDSYALHDYDEVFDE